MVDMKDFAEFEALVNSSFENGMENFSKAREYIKSVSRISNNKELGKSQERNGEERI